MMTLRAIRADITTLDVDAIANVANSSLLGGGAGERDLLASCYERLLGGAVTGGGGIS